MDLNKFKNDIFLIDNDDQFNQLAIKLFKHQSQENLIYKKYIELLNKDVNNIVSIEEIPFLPIETFKNNKVLCRNKSAQKVFISSGTTMGERSKHHIESIRFYEKSIQLSFERTFGSIDNYTIFCLTPEKKEEGQSSLIYMCNYLVKESRCPSSGFYWKKQNQLKKEIICAQEKKKPFILIGLSFLILDFAQRFEPNLKRGIVIETGGMKNYKKEIKKEQLYDILKQKFNLAHIGSEYSMTELLSQSYSKKEGEFQEPPWKKILLRDYNNPLKILTKKNSTGPINIIDLANTHSCAFIATNDVGRKNDNYFNVLGRLNNSLIRGCNNMI